MMNEGSKKRLSTCHPELILLFNEVADDEEIQIIEGHRSIEKQKEMIRTGKSSLKNAANGKHVKSPSEAVDAAPLINKKIEWDNTKCFIDFAQKVLKIADRLYKEGRMKRKIRWGGDWNMNGEWKDEKFLDLVHFELV